jgi:hypothetical protein
MIHYFSEGAPFHYKRNEVKEGRKKERKKDRTDREKKIKSCHHMPGLGAKH